MCDFLVIASLVLFDTLQINTCTASGISENATRKFSFVSVLTHKIILLLPHSVNAMLLKWQSWFQILQSWRLRLMQKLLRQGC